MKLLLLLAAFFVGYAESFRISQSINRIPFPTEPVTYPCPSQDGIFASCSALTLYVVDSGNDLSYFPVESEYNWLRFYVLPRTEWFNYIQVAFSSYGSGPQITYSPTMDRELACSHLDELQNEYRQYPSDRSSIYDALTMIHDFYEHLDNIILLTGSKDIFDIQNAAQYIKGYMSSTSFTVVAINGSIIDESNFPATVYRVNDLNNPPTNLDWCVVNRACGLDPDCYINEIPTVAPSSPTPSTPRATKPTPYFTTFSPKTTTTKNAPTTSPSSSPSSLQCQCDTMSAWLDIMFVIDASASTGAAGLNEMWGLAGTMLDLFNVQRTIYTGSNYTSRVGIVTYGNDANVLYPLGSLDNNMIDSLLDLPFNNDPLANLEAAIMAADAQFNGPNHRSNARKVIIAMAAAFNPEGQNAPNKTAQTFKEDGGIIVVYNYVPPHSLESSMLASLASSGYFFSTLLNDQYTDMALALCDANCFCRSDLIPYGLSSPKQLPTKGCYAKILAGSNYARAKNNCKLNYYNGIVAVDEDAAKTTFLKGLLPSYSFYIGLAYDNTDKSWEWSDGSYPGGYQPWAGGRAPDGTSGQCAFVDSNSQWQPTDCRNGYYYVCEVVPCDSTRYCE